MAAPVPDWAKRVTPEEMHEFRVLVITEILLGVISLNSAQRKAFAEKIVKDFEEREWLRV